MYLVWHMLWRGRQPDYPGNLWGGGGSFSRTLCLQQAGQVNLPPWNSFNNEQNSCSQDLECIHGSNKTLFVCNKSQITRLFEDMVTIWEEKFQIFSSFLLFRYSLYIGQKRILVVVLQANARFWFTLLEFW